MTPLQSSYREMPLTKGKVAIVDEADYMRLSRWKWSYSNSGYAMRGTTAGGKKSRGYTMHRQILGLIHGDGKEVDHINKDRLDNRRANLRVVTRKENCANRSARSRSEHAECTRLESLFPLGASVNYWHGKWIVKIPPIYRQSAKSVEDLAKRFFRWYGCNV